ncbi:DNA-directed RNA polymerase III RPC11 [Histomonas meleagridis]|uniref:DNA-directed RNA polymerase III RPC11 n=1 Tax=Histomonas meleagridis TaxID=135588 RepID=UPI0035593E98|nr:DNA-directed RNA polymerase III RPC11 [Histomonas meleagridis]KAH0798803.1 DNA-directed RNA polymerase III RPC11 [Histomonas meleagridis]
MSHSFCPACGNLLLIDAAGAHTKMRCRSCPFVMDFQGTKVQNAELHPLDTNSFIISDNTTAFTNKTTCKCEKCGHNEAYFIEIQIRSADEPATLFFCCCKCKHTWREG